MNSDLSNREVEEVLPFITFERNIKDGKELILFNKSDKEMFFNHFPELKNKFWKMNFGKFNDRKYEEALFWNDFFYDQLK